MLSGWSLRTKLVGVVTLALLPVLALVTWHATGELRQKEIHREVAVAAAAEIVAGRHLELIAGSRRLLTAVCAEDAVRASAAASPPASDVDRCDAYLGRVLAAFPHDYSSAMVTDAQGVARCSSAPTAIGAGFADRETFRLVRDSRKFTIGAQIASRITSDTVIPTALPILEGGDFRGMCALGISLRSFAELATPLRTSDSIAVSLVDRAGMSVGGSPEATRTLPVPARVAAAIVGGQTVFRDYGQDSQLYAFRVLPLADTPLFVVAAAPVAEGLPSLIADWGGVALVLLAIGAAMLTLWVGSDRWCVRPLRYIRDFADRVARGDDMTLEPHRQWGPELSAVGEAVKAMELAIATREAELKAGLEQRDHMLREIHHRVKNNLQMISSLLNLQAGEIRSPRIRRFFGDAQNRVLTLSILHRHLYERSSWSLVDFQQFISDLVRQISVGRRAPDRPLPRYHIRAPIMAVGPDVAIPVGLIVTEAVSSALNRRFDGLAAPEIRIEAADKDGTVELSIEDNGVGEGGAIKPDGRAGFSLTLIRGLAMQLGGEAQVTAREAGGMRVSVTFPTPQDQEADA
ncbi:sensor histidine kinase [soil metagenome]